jgi:hypothetical protein
MRIGQQLRFSRRKEGFILENECYVCLSVCLSAATLCSDFVHISFRYYVTLVSNFEVIVKPFKCCTKLQYC